MSLLAPVAARFEGVSEPSVQQHRGHARHLERHIVRIRVRPRTSRSPPAWALSRPYICETERHACACAWPHMRQRGHTALGGLPPTGRGTNLSGQNTWRVGAAAAAHGDRAARSPPAWTRHRGRCRLSPTAWLPDELVPRGNRVVGGSASDTDGDGLAGWPDGRRAR